MKRTRVWDMPVPTLLRWLRCRLFGHPISRRGDVEIVQVWIEGDYAGVFCWNCGEKLWTTRPSSSPQESRP